MYAVKSIMIGRSQKESRDRDDAVREARAASLAKRAGLYTFLILRNGQ